MSGQPLVSVLMTAYNRQQFIAEAIESVLASTYKNWELIIVDDDSKDNTVPIAKSFCTKDNRIRLYVNKKNLGDYPNRNRAASLANGELLMWCDSDDTLLEESMAKCINLLEQFPQVQFGVTANVDKNSQINIKSEVAIRRHFFDKPFLLKGPGGTVYRNQYFKQIGGYPEKYGPANDMYFNLKAAMQTEILLIPFELIQYRRHDGQEINNKLSYLFNNYRYLKDALNELNLPITATELSFLQNKNRRRFVTNILRFYFNTFNWSDTKYAIRNANFTIEDALRGIFH